MSLKCMVGATLRPTPTLKNVPSLACETLAYGEACPVDEEKIKLISLIDELSWLISIFKKVSGVLTHRQICLSPEC